MKDFAPGARDPETKETSKEKKIKIVFDYIYIFLLKELTWSLREKSTAL